MVKYKIYNDLKRKKLPELILLLMQVAVTQGTTLIHIRVLLNYNIRINEYKYERGETWNVYFKFDYHTFTYL